MDRKTSKMLAANGGKVARIYGCPTGVMLSDCRITQDAKKNRIQLQGTHRNELQPNGVHDREVCVSPENVWKICMLGYQH